MTQSVVWPAPSITGVGLQDSAKPGSSRSTIEKIATGLRSSYLKDWAIRSWEDDYHSGITPGSPSWAESSWNERPLPISSLPPSRGGYSTSLAVSDAQGGFYEEALKVQQQTMGKLLETVWSTEEIKAALGYSPSSSSTTAHPEKTRGVTPTSTTYSYPCAVASVLPVVGLGN